MTFSLNVKSGDEVETSWHYCSKRSSTQLFSFYVIDKGTAYIGTMIDLNYLVSCGTTQQG